MTTDLPPTCSLTDSELTQRRERMRVLADRALIDGTETPVGRRLRFQDRPEVEREIEALIAAEARCCPFLTFALRRTDGELVLDVTAPPEAGGLLEPLFEQPPTARDR
jgi:hypothetical protein